MNENEISSTPSPAPIRAYGRLVETSRPRPTCQIRAKRNKYAYLDSLTVDSGPIEIDLAISGLSDLDKAREVVSLRLYQVFSARRAKAKKAGLPLPKYVLDWDEVERRLYVWLVP
jgi:hypothetical protein